MAESGSAQRAGRRRRRGSEVPAVPAPPLVPTQVHDAAESDASIEPLMMVFERDDEDEETRIQIVQSGFGSMADWGALLNSWRGGLTSLIALVSESSVELARAMSVLARERLLQPIPARP